LKTAKERGVQNGGSSPADWRIGEFADLQIYGFADSADQITAKPLVQMKNLYRLKDSLEPCLDGAKVIQQLLVHSELRNQVHHLYYERGIYKGVRGRDSLSVSRHRT
jgi:hypothetical protein